MKFINNMGYIRGVTPVTKAYEKRLECLIDILLLVKTLLEKREEPLLVSFEVLSFRAF